MKVHRSDLPLTAKRLLLDPHAGAGRVVEVQPVEERRVAGSPFEADVFRGLADQPPAPAARRLKAARIRSGPYELDHVAGGDVPRYIVSAPMEEAPGGAVWRFLSNGSPSDLPV